VVYCIQYQHKPAIKSHSVQSKGEKSTASTKNSITDHRYNDTYWLLLHCICLQMMSHWHRLNYTTLHLFGDHGTLWQFS